MIEVSIPARFCGPPTSGNGGYVSGLLATALQRTSRDTVQVTLRKPPPLERALQIDVDDAAGRARLLDGETLIAEAERAPLELSVPRAPSLARAEEWSRGYAGFLSHAFPRCFVCGPERAEGDGLRIFPGKSPDRTLVAAPWTPHASLLDAAGKLPAAVGWAALDCAGYFAAGHPDFAVLGQICAELPLPLTAAERYLVLGWSIAREGRKIFAGTALFDERGVLRGKSRQVWIATA